MSRLIDADALVEYLKKIWGKWDEDDWYEAQAKDAMKDDIEIVNEQPTIDAVQVVRCKDCKYYDVFDNVDGVDFGGCARPCSALRADCWVSENWFCADGERKENYDLQ